MQIHRVYHQQAKQAEGIVIVIDVIRAFSVAAYAFAGGASSIWLVRTPEEALALREQDPTALLAGEIGGRLIPGFDLNNSPFLVSQADVRNKRIIQRTGAGTQGAVKARNAAHLLICSLVNARSTALYAQELSEKSGLPIALFPTASSSTQTESNEDDYCADYIEALLTNGPTALDLLQARITSLFERDRFAHWSGDARDEQDFPVGDLDKILAIDSLHFVMPGTSRQFSHAGFPEPIHYIEVQRIDR